MDQQIRQLAELQIFETGEEIDHLEHSLEYEELQRVAWAAEIANDDETLLHIADLMVKKQQSATLVTSLNDDVKNYKFGPEEKRLIYAAYDGKVRRLQSAIDYVMAVSEKRSYSKIKDPLVNYLKILI